MCEGLTRESLALGECRAAEGHRLDHLGVAVGRDHDRDVRVVLGCGTHHRRSTDVDLLNRVVAGHPGGDRLDEGIEVHHDEFERTDVEVGELLLMVCEPQVSQDSGVDRRMQRLHAPVEGLLESGDARDFGHGVPGIRNGRRSRTGGNDLDPGDSERGG